MDTQRTSAGDSIMVHGAGAIGLSLGGRLAASGVPVHFVGRPPVVDALRRNGLRIIDLSGRCTELAPDRYSASTSPSDAEPPALVLLTVKGVATAAAGAELQSALRPGTPVVSFQNGVDNPARLAAAAPDLQVIAGMVPFNVVRPAPTTVQQTTSGRLAIEAGPVASRWSSAFAAAGLPLAIHRDMRAVQWGKLLLNLNNPLNALGGMPLLQQLEDRDWRRLLARLQDEALAALRAAGIRPARATPLPAAWLPTLLRLPNPLFRVLARRMLTIHPEARLSMHADRAAGRPTEVDDLCGAVVRLSAAHGLDAPANRAVQRLVETAAADRCYSAAELQAWLSESRRT